MQKNKEKILVFDLDKTLLRNNGLISEYSKEVITTLNRKGFFIVIATGRAINRSKEFCEQIGADGLVALNGSITYLKEQVLAQSPIDSDLIYDMIQQILSIGNVFITIAYPTFMLTNNKKYVVKGICEYTDYKSFNLEEIQKINVFTSCVDEILRFNFDRYECKLISNSTDPNYFVITQKNVNKLRGIEKLCGELNFKLRDVISFGDDYNDLEMLSKCGIGVAVENASDEIKKYADFICKSNNNDGPADWLNEYYCLGF